MKQYQLLIFDWDGTLMDSVGKIVACIQASSRSLELAVPSESAVRDIIGLSMHKALHTLHDNLDDVIYNKMIELYRQQYLELNDTPSPLFEGAESLIQQLDQKGYQLAVATGKARAGLTRVLNETGLGHYFIASRCADEALSKPNPEMINQLLIERHVTPEQCLMIGDSLHDLNMANSAGVDAIGVSYGAHGTSKLSRANPKAMINAPLDLLNYLGH